MSKLVRSLALMAALGFLSAGTVSLAQEKGKAATKKAEKAGEKAADKADKVGTIEYYKNDSGKWRFIIKNEEGKSIVMPLAQISFESKEDCLKMIDFLKKTLNEAKPTERKDEKKK